MGNSIQHGKSQTKSTIAGNLVLSVLERLGWLFFFFFAIHSTGKFLIFGGNIACKANEITQSMSTSDGKRCFSTGSES